MAIELKVNNSSLTFTGSTSTSGGSGGAVSSVNGKVGAVVLTAKDVGALPDTTVIPNVEEFATKEYVNEAVANLDIDTENINLSNYYTKTETDTKINEAIGSLDINPEDIDLSNYYTKVETNAKLLDYYTKNETDTKIQDAIDEIPETDLTGYATQEYVSQKVAEAQLDGADVDLSAYYTKSETNQLVETEVNTSITEAVKPYALKTELEDYATQEYVDNAVATGNLENYYTKAETNSLISSTHADFATKSDIANLPTTEDVAAAIEEKTADFVDEDTIYSDMLESFGGGVDYRGGAYGLYRKHPIYRSATFEPTALGITDQGPNGLGVSGITDAYSLAHSLEEGRICYWWHHTQSNIQLSAGYFRSKNIRDANSGGMHVNKIYRIIGNNCAYTEYDFKELADKPIFYGSNGAPCPASIFFMWDGDIYYLPNGYNWRWLVPFFNRFWYDNTGTNLTSTDTQNAITELAINMENMEVEWNNTIQTSFYTKSQVDGLVSRIENMPEIHVGTDEPDFNALFWINPEATEDDVADTFATKEYVDQAVANSGGGGNVDLTGYATEAYVGTAITNALSGIKMAEEGAY